MRKKKHAKKHSVTRTRNKKPSQSATRRLDLEFFTRYIVVPFSILLLIIFGGVLYKGGQKPRVLGASVFLADHGSDDGSGDTGPDMSGDTQSEKLSNTNNPPPPINGEQTIIQPELHDAEPAENDMAQQPQQQAGANNAGNPSSNTFVNCSGPDGKQFSTTFGACSQLNQGWGQTTFHFTPLQMHSDVDHDGSQSGIPLPHISETNGNDHITASAGAHLKDTRHGKNGKDRDNGLGDAHLEIGSSSANTFMIRRGNISTESQFPISLDEATNSMSVMTPSGKQPIAVLPDQAVAHVLQNKVLDAVEEQASPDSSSSATERVTLTELNNLPVFEMKGVSNKKVLGIIPVSFAKDVFVSAETGSVIQTNETPFSKFLELFSF